MLKKTALSLFGLAVMLVCVNPPQASAGVIVALGPVYPHRVRVYAPPRYGYVAPRPFVVYRPNPYAYRPAYVYPSRVYRPGFYGPEYWAPRRYVRREVIVRRPYWRR